MDIREEKDEGKERDGRDVEIDLFRQEMALSLHRHFSHVFFFAITQREKSSTSRDALTRTSGHREGIAVFP